MKIKVCGMRDAENIRRVGALDIDFMGFIFYPKSPRFVGSDLSPEVLKGLPPSVRKTGVFVDEKPEVVVDYAKRYALDAVQVYHSNQGMGYFSVLREWLPPGVALIRAMPVAESIDLALATAYARTYATARDYLLFDAKTPLYGGSGQQFDWSMVRLYRGNTPFFLSGGISAEDVGRLGAIKHPMFYGVDLNSRFEVAPGLKDEHLLQPFIEALRHEPNTAVL